MINERILSDEIIDFYNGRIHICDNIFLLTLNDESSITGDLSYDISNEYFKVDSEICYVTIGKSIIYDQEIGDSYLSYRLIDMLI